MSIGAIFGGANGIISGAIDGYFEGKKTPDCDPCRRNWKEKNCSSHPTGTYTTKQRSWKVIKEAALFGVMTSLFGAAVQALAEYGFSLAGITLSNTAITIGAATLFGVPLVLLVAMIGYKTLSAKKA